MAGMMDELMGALGGGEGGVGGLLGGLLGGGDSAKNESAAGMGLEAILGGMAQNAKTKRGADSIADAVARHDGSALDKLSSTFGSQTATADGQKILGHVFGKNQEAVTAGIAKKSGLDLGAIVKLLPALAPIVMGFLSRKKDDGGLDASGLASALGGESAGFDLGDLTGLLGGGTGTGGIMEIIKGFLGGR